MQLLNHLTDLALDLFHAATQGNHSTSQQGRPPGAVSTPPDIGLVRGQRKAKEALLIAAAGRHNILMVGPPGEGKSYLASTIPGYLPSIRSQSGVQSLASIYQYSSVPIPQDALGAVLRPFRGIGPTITLASLIGGGRAEPIPGEISLAHTGVLFLDELPQFSKPLIDSLRSPLEAKQVNITRNGASYTFPCDFMLVAAMNPCPCGYAGIEFPRQIGEAPLTKGTGYRPSMSACVCSESTIERYQSRISGPILDRIDLVVEIGALSSQERFSPAIPNQSALFKQKILQAWNIAYRMRGMLNCDLGPKEVLDESRRVVMECNIRVDQHEVYPPLFGPLAWTIEGLKYFKAICDQKSYSTRRAIRLARISRTIADLSNCYGIVPQHIQTASSYLQSELLP